MIRPRIGAVSYLNTKPLVAGLNVGDLEYELRFDLPSKLADQLATDQLDVGLIPVIEAVKRPDYTIVSDACIACRGPVWSVKLMSRVPLDQIKTMAMDEGSRTSQTLCRVILSNCHGVTPSCSLLPIEADWTRTDADAALIIGDRAMKADHADFPVSIDLGEAWFSWTSRPFVFAVWAARPGVDLDYLSQLLSISRDRGRERLNPIADAHADSYGLTKDQCRSYLSDFIHYDLGDAQKQGMQEYFRMASQLSLIPPVAPLQFHDCQTA